MALTDDTATIVLEAGSVTGDDRIVTSSTTMYAGLGIYVTNSRPVNYGPAYSVHFDSADQLTFVRSLAKEMRRLRILDAVVTDAKTGIKTDHRVKLTFDRTHHDPKYQIYTLAVSLCIESEHSAFFDKYHIVSHHSWYDRWFTNASQGKKKAAQQLLDAVMKDIQDYLAIGV